MSIISNAKNFTKYNLLGYGFDKLTNRPNQHELFLEKELFNQMVKYADIHSNEKHYENPFSYLSTKNLKNDPVTTTPEPEGVFEYTIPGIKKEIVAKSIASSKYNLSENKLFELAILLEANKLKLPTAKVVGLLNDRYILMEKLSGISMLDLVPYLVEMSQGYLDYPIISVDDIKDLLIQIADMNKSNAEKFRRVLNIDKFWKLSDLIIDINLDTLEIKKVYNLDWESVTEFDGQNPRDIENPYLFVARKFPDLKIYFNLPTKDSNKLCDYPSW